MFSFASKPRLSAESPLSAASVSGTFWAYTSSKAPLDAGRLQRRLVALHEAEAVLLLRKPGAAVNAPAESALDSWGLDAIDDFSLVLSDGGRAQLLRLCFFSGRRTRQPGPVDHLSLPDRAHCSRHWTATDIILSNRPGQRFLFLGSDAGGGATLRQKREASENLRRRIERSARSLARGAATRGGRPSDAPRPLLRLSPPPRGAVPRHLQRRRQQRRHRQWRSVQWQSLCRC